MNSERADLIVWWHQKWGGPDLPSLVLSLRQACNGAADSWGDSYLVEVVHYLEGRLRLWQEPSDAIDSHVKGMCEQAVWIGRAEMASIEAERLDREERQSPSS